MRDLTDKEQQYCLEAFESMIRKLNKTIETMAAKGSKNLATPQNRRFACEVALSMLHHHWNKTEFTYSLSEVKDAQQILLRIRPSIQKQLPKFVENTPQHTIAMRRLLALDVVADYLQEFLTR